MKKITLATLGCLFVFQAYSQNQAPVIVTDTIEVYTQSVFEIDALANDYDPDGNAIYISSWTNPIFCDVDTSNRKFILKTEARDLYTQFNYFITDNGTPPLTSAKGRVLIHIRVNPNAPVAFPDTCQVTELIPVQLDLLANDYDLNSSEYKIEQIFHPHGCKVNLTEDSLYVIVIADPTNDYQADFEYNLIEINTADSLISPTVQTELLVLPNPDLPVAINDTISTTGGTETILNILINDYDPQNEPFRILNYSEPSHGNLILNNGNLIYTPAVSYTGGDGFKYTICEVNDTSVYSKKGVVFLSVAKNPDCPQGMPDYASGIAYEPILIDVLANDSQLNPDEIIPIDVESNGIDAIVGNQVSFTSYPTRTGPDTLFYKIAKKYQLQYYSEWIPVYLDISVNPDFPVALPDSAVARSGFSILINPLKNDIKNAYDSLGIMTPSFYNYNEIRKGIAEAISDSILEYIPFSTSVGWDSIEYFIWDKTGKKVCAKSLVYINIIDNHFHDSVDINLINAGVNADGLLFCKHMSVPGTEGIYGFEAHFKYPDGSAKNTILTSSLWFGGLDENNDLHYAGEQYKLFGSDFHSGPVAEDYDSIYHETYQRLWKLNKTDIDYHRNNWNKPGYEPVRDITTWPGTRNIMGGKSENLAPYFDFDHDGTYQPLNGDYPLIRGDQCVFIIYNDDQPHTESGGEKLKLEIHGMIYEFDDQGDSVLEHTVFVHYDLINRSDAIYHDSFTANFTDFDIGYYFDDYIGCDVTRSAFYACNGDVFDEDLYDNYYDIEGYGSFPPAQGVVVLAGPLMDHDGFDNPSGGCDFSINGTNFGNEIIDDERFGLTRFTYFTNSGSAEPAILADDHFLLMNGY